MKNTGKKYEQLVQQVYQQIINDENKSNLVDVKHDITLKGKSTTHQIDVFWEFNFAGLKYAAVIEAKDWTTKIPQEKLMAFKSKIDDLKFSVLPIFVSKNGFQKGAIDYAKKNKILLYEFREPNEKDWEGRLKTININVTINIPSCSISKIEMDWKYIYEQTQDKDQFKNSFKFQFTASPNEFFIYDDTFSPTSTIEELILSQYRSIPINTTQNQKATINFPKLSFIKYPAFGIEYLKIKYLEFDITFETFTENITIDLTNMVGYVFKNINDNKIDFYDQSLIKLNSHKGT